MVVTESPNRTQDLGWIKPFQRIKVNAAIGWYSIMLLGILVKSSVHRIRAPDFQKLCNMLVSWMRSEMMIGCIEKNLLAGKASGLIFSPKNGG
jgi:hypothetical protein